MNTLGALSDLSRTRLPDNQKSCSCKEQKMKLKKKIYLLAPLNVVAFTIICLTFYVAYTFNQTTVEKAERVDSIRLFVNDLEKNLYQLKATGDDFLITKDHAYIDEFEETAILAAKEVANLDQMLSSEFPGEFLFV